MKKIFLLIISITSAATVATAQDKPSVFTCRIGEAEVSLLSEGQAGADISILIGATPEMLARYAPDSVIPNAVNAFLIRLPDKTIVVDAGFGLRLEDNLRQCGVRPEDVDVVLLTHMHGDHILGMMQKEEERIAFPRATVYLSKDEHDYWTSDEEMNRQPADRHSAFWNARRVITSYAHRVILFHTQETGKSATPLLPGIYGLAAYGHTPGHTMYLLESDGERLLIWGDLTHAMAVQMPHPEVAVVYDANPEQAVRARQATLDYVAEQGIPIAGMHIAWPGIGKVFRHGNGYFFAPQLDTAGIVGAVSRQLQRYPESRLTDIYKNFFQDYFGPGHLIKDTASVDRYLQQELASCGKCTGQWTESTGGEGRFYRVDLCVLKENRMDYRTFLNAFIESANYTVTPPPEAWIDTWNEIIRILDTMPLSIPDYAADKAALQSLLQSGHYAVHHSKAYEQRYKPHYRIISKALLERLITLP
ncbi:MAG: MBL fold metallo-hydrolase [Prevotellaceae bacterium]|jgi:glyoxylase-like metal-dependent hydrolase (beta-lactamase superfamily II)|nr:MBL fold metallo-hydrolase [Prevotellaceae bacterium]